MQCTDSLFLTFFKFYRLHYKYQNKFKYKNLYSVTFSKKTLKKARQCSCFCPYVLVCTRVLPVCCSYVLVYTVCYLYVLVCTCMLLVCTRVYLCGVLVMILHTGEFFQKTGGTAISSEVPLCRESCLQNCSPRQNHSHMVKGIY